MDACTNHACENGATCKVTGEDSYRCQCPNGYFGDNCEKGIADKNGKNWAAGSCLGSSKSFIEKKEARVGVYTCCGSIISLV